MTKKTSKIGPSSRTGFIFWLLFTDTVKVINLFWSKNCLDNNLCDFLLTHLVTLFQEDLLIHGDSVYDIIDKQDHSSIQSELMRGLHQDHGSVIS
jgi:hypothetical protein